MSQPRHAPPRPPRPPVPGADIAISIIVLVLTALMIAAGGFFGLFSLAFLDHCPPESCSEQGAVNAVGNALFAAVGIGVVGLTTTAVQLSRRRRGWPIATATLVLCLIAFVIGGVGYSMAVS